MKPLNTISLGMKETSYLSKVWATIEQMPIYNWMKVLETSDLKWLFISGKGRVIKKTAEHWLELQQQYIDEFGLDENYKLQLKLMEKLKNLNCDFVITGERHYLNVIKMVEIDLEQKNSQKVIKFFEMLDHVEKYKGYEIDPHKTSVLKYYYTLKNMSNGASN